MNAPLTSNLGREISVPAFMMTRADETEDEALNRAWRARYGQPLPVTGSTEIARRILMEWASAPAIREPADWTQDDAPLPAPGPPLSS